MVRALASHQCGLGLNPKLDIIMWVESAVSSFYLSSFNHLSAVQIGNTLLQYDFIIVWNY